MRSTELINFQFDLQELIAPSVHYVMKRQTIAIDIWLIVHGVNFMVRELANSSDNMADSKLDDKYIIRD